jgi:hypothetical protein
VIVLGGGGGMIDEYKGAMLASHGYAALNLAHFAQPGLPRGLVNIPLEYFENAIRWMRKRCASTRSRSAETHRMMSTW